MTDGTRLNDESLTEDQGSRPKRRDGLRHDPKSLPGLVETLGHLERLLSFNLKSMATCMPMLNFSTSFHELRRMHEEVTALRAAILRASTIIATDTPLAVRFPDEEQTWLLQGKPLSPKQLTFLATLAADNPQGETVAYSSVISELVLDPPHVGYFKEQAQLEENFRAAMRNSCPRCRAKAGEICVSKNGKSTSMHQGRYNR